MLDPNHTAVLEALLDPRIDIEAPPEVVAALREQGLLDGNEAAARLRAIRTEQPVEWISMSLTQGEILAAFARHCDEELEEVTVVEAEPDLLVARWRDEISRMELRAGFVGFEQLVADGPTMLIGVMGDEVDALVTAFLDDAELRSKLAVCDLTRLERIGTPRSSVFVYFDWFLREAYSVRLLPTGAFTQGLIDRGIISLGMG